MCHSLPWFSTVTSIKSGGVKLVIWAKSSPLNEIMWSYKSFMDSNIGQLLLESPICLYNLQLSIVTELIVQMYSIICVRAP